MLFMLSLTHARAHTPTYARVFFFKLTSSCCYKYSEERIMQFFNRKPPEDKLHVAQDFKKLHIRDLQKNH